MTLKRSLGEWRALLTAEQFRVLRENGTERPFTNIYCNSVETGEYRCVGCDSLLFDSKDKFLSPCGWPAFSQPATDKIVLKQDSSCGMERVEVRCGNCDGHLGHVFEDELSPLGSRYCINSVCLKFTNK